METYTLPLVRAQSSTYVVLPFDARAASGREKGTLYVQGTLNGVPYRGRLTSLGGGQQALFVTKAMQQQAGIGGDTETVALTAELVPEERALLTQPGVVAEGGMDVLRAITTRRSARQYTEQPVSQKAVTTLLNAGFCAPSASNKRPWHFVVVRERATLEQLAAVSPYAKMMRTAPLALVVCGDAMLQGIEELLLEDCAAAVQSMLLAAHGMGLGAVWCGITRRGGRRAQLAALLGLPAKVVPAAMLAVGHPANAQNTVPRPRFDETKVHFETWTRCTGGTADAPTAPQGDAKGAT